MPLRIVLADDHQIVREGLRALLEKEGLAVVGEANDGSEAVRLTETLHPDVALLDLTMPVLNGLDAARQIRRTSPRTATVLLTVHTESAYVLRALQAGIRGYVVKTQAVSELVQAVREVAGGGTYVSPRLSGVLVHAYLARRAPESDALTPRERQVLQLVAEGKTTKEAAKFLGVATKTAESHRTRLMEKLGIHDTAGLVRYAIRHGFIEA